MTKQETKEINEPSKTNWGRFYISYEMVNKNIITLKTIMNRMAFIGKAQMLPQLKMVEYHCRSELFAPLEMDDATKEVPEYIIVVDNDGEVRAEKGECLKIDSAPKKNNK